MKAAGIGASARGSVIASPTAVELGLPLADQYRPPTGVPMASSSASSASPSVTSVAPALSARCFGVLVPGIGMTCEPCAPQYGSTSAVTSRAPASAVDHLHLGGVVVITGGGGRAVQLRELVSAQPHAVRGDVLLQPRNPLGAGDRDDVVTLGEQPRQRDLGRGGSHLRSDRDDLVGGGQVSLEVLVGEARVVLAHIGVGEALG